MRARSRRPTVAHVTRYVADYRGPYFTRLREELGERGIDFRLIHGQAGPVDAPRSDEISLPFSEKVQNRYVLIRGREVCWQPYLSRLRDVDLAIVDQGARLLATYALLLWRRSGGPAVALWGHGQHFDGERAMPLAEALKGFVARRADWWFPYTQRSVEVVLGLGVRPERVTLMENAVDTSELAALRNSLTDDDLAQQVTLLGLEQRAKAGKVTSHLGVYTGAIYSKKRPQFLVASADVVRRRLPDFELVVVGDGPSISVVREAARSRPWLHPVGPRFGLEKVRCLALGRALLLPGLVGLNVLDGFALGLPPITTAVPYHSHEVSYLEDGVNGVIVRDVDDPVAYAEAVVRVMTDDVLHERLVRGCRTSAMHYTIENMASNVADGCVAALRATGRWRSL
jgi:glycosyltransferase involved in cell wall biosynthesis